MNVLLLEYGGLGDGMILAPYIFQLNEKYPEINLFQTGNPIFQSSILSLAGLDRHLVSVVPRRWSFCSPKLLPEFLAFIRNNNIATVLILQCDPEYAFDCESLGKAVVKQTAALAKWVDYTAWSCNPTPISGEIRKVLEYFFPKIEEPPEAWLKSYITRTVPKGITIYTGASVPGRCLPVPFVCALIGELISDGIDDICIVSGSEEENLFPSYQSLLSRYGNKTKFMGGLSLDQLILEVASSELLISSDTGPAHLAGALGIPQLGIFWRSDPRRWLPCNKFSTAICTADKPQSCSAHEIAAHSREFLDTRAWPQRFHNIDSITNISFRNNQIENFDKSTSPPFDLKNAITALHEYGLVVSPVLITEKTGKAYTFLSEPIPNSSFSCFCKKCSYYSYAEVKGVTWRFIEDEWVMHEINGNGSVMKDKDRPVSDITCYDALQFCKWLGKSTGMLVRLPSLEELETYFRTTSQPRQRPNQVEPYWLEWCDDSCDNKSEGQFSAEPYYERSPIMVMCAENGHFSSWPSLIPKRHSCNLLGFRIVAEVPNGL